MTAKYRALQALYIDRLIQPGEEFESELHAGRNWEPLNDAARKACADRDAKRGMVNAVAAKLDPQIPSIKSVEISDDWKLLSKNARRQLAIKLGAPNTVKASEADGFIEAELERRGQLQAA